MRVANKNIRLTGWLALAALLMFGFGYALVPLYKLFCEVTGINVLAVVDRKAVAEQVGEPVNTQVDTSRTITVEFDANVRGPWYFKPEKSHVQAHPGQLMTVMYEFQNRQDRRITAQAIPSYAPDQAKLYFNKLQCFCFQQYTLEPGEKKSWPVVFVIDSRLADEVKNITLSYTFFEIGGKTPPAPTVLSPVPSVAEGQG